MLTSEASKRGRCVLTSCPEGSVLTSFKSPASGSWISIRHVRKLTLLQPCVQ
jgi:hypothetical protein